MKQVLKTRVIPGLVIMFGVLTLAYSAQARVLLKNDFPIHSTPYFENTAKVIPPLAGCPQGRIVVSTGQTSSWNTGKILDRPLYGGSGHIDTTTPTIEVDFPTGSTKAVATDNQIVRLKDGSLLIVRDGFIWDDISPNPPEWFIDLATLLGGKYGFPRPMDDVRTLRAHDPKDYSVLYFNFIDPDYIDIPAETPSNTSVAYWIKVPRPRLTDRNMVFEGDFNTSCPAHLSVQDGKPRTWSTRQDLGDYMAGGFFWRNNKLKYLAQWVEPTGIRANIITLPYQLPSGNPTMTVTAVWRPVEQPEVQVYDWKYDDFRKKYDELWPPGLALTSPREPRPQHTVVWRRSTSGEIQVYEWSYEDFRKKYDELWCDGWRLKILAVH